MDGVLYLCGQCNQPLDGDSLQNHVCWQNVLAESVEGEQEIDETVTVNEEEDVNNLVTLYTDETRKKPAKARRGEWADEDVHRLIAAYMKNFRALPKQGGLHNHYFWDRVMRDLRPYGDFSRFLVQTKVKKLKHVCRLLQRLDPNTKWPFFNEMCELLRLEKMATLRTNLTEMVESANDSENDSSEPNSEVQGLRRWTVKETRHLLEIYRKHLSSMTISGNRRKTAWNDIVAELDYDLSRKFSMIQIRSRIRNVFTTYRSIVAQKRKRQQTHWPLFKDVGDLLKEEQQLFPNSVGNIETDDAFLAEDEEYDPRNCRWNVEETEELITAYLEHISELTAADTDEAAENAWDKITMQVNAIRRRKVTSITVRNKIHSLRTMFTNDDEKSLGPLYDHVQLMIQAERPFNNPSFNFYKKKSVKRKSFYNSSSKKKQAIDNNLPDWYVQYSEDAQRRHSEKISVHENMIRVLERVLIKK